MKGIFYAVGVGPGDPDLLTVKAIKTITKSDVIAVPDSGASENIALSIAGKYIKDKHTLFVKMPMIKNKEQLNEYHDKAAAEISNILDSGKSVAFLTIGDPTVYSTVMYVHKRIKDRGYETEVVSGITSFCAAAAALEQTLCMRDEMLHIIPATFNDINSVIGLSGTKVLMKSGKSISGFIDKLKDKNLLAVECASMKNQKLYKSADELGKNMSYFSVIIVSD